MLNINERMLHKENIYQILAMRVHLQQYEKNQHDIRDRLQM